MRSDDAYRTLIDDVARQLNGWAEAFKARARIAIDPAADQLRVLSIPAAREACAFELSLRPDQHFDIAIGPETYEDLPVSSVSLFRDLAVAISTGDVVTREILSAVTGRRLSVETRVSIGRDLVWSRSRLLAPSLPEQISYIDRHYLP